MDTGMQEFYGHAIGPPQFQWQTAPPQIAKAGTVPPAAVPDTQIDAQQEDFFPTDYGDYVPDLPLPDPESGPTRSANTGFGGPAPTPPSYSNDARRNLTATPEQPRRLSQRLPVRQQANII